MAVDGGADGSAQDVGPLGEGSDGADVGGGEDESVGVAAEDSDVVDEDDGGEDAKGAALSLGG